MWTIEVILRISAAGGRAGGSAPATEEIRRPGSAREPLRVNQTDQQEQQAQKHARGNNHRQTRSEPLSWDESALASRGCR